MEHISNQLRENFVALIAQQTGIEIRAQNYGSLSDNILSRVKALSLPSPMAYYEMLSSLNVRGEAEWQQFVCLVTNRESYFFRDKGQFALLRQQILPEIIRRNQRSKMLRICSAGCSTGQEPYSLGILLRELIPDVDNWSLEIIGIDINRESLAHAQKALYNTWSFRQVADDIKQRYFKNLAGYYQLNPEIKQLVKFHQVNLVRDQLPKLDLQLSELDLIICRNVFIYFTEQAIAKVVEKFFHTLKTNGYLLTGHAELRSHHLKAFHSQVFPESVIYQKRDGAIPLVQPSPKPQPSAIETLAVQLAKTQIKPSSPLSPQKPLKAPDSKVAVPTVPPSPLLAEVTALMNSKSYNLALKKLEAILQTAPRQFLAHYLMAELKANLGQHEQAKEWCQKAINLETFSAQPYHLLAQIYEEQGNLLDAKQALKKIIYLEPDSVPAYLNLANLYRQEGDYHRAGKMRQSALKILRKLPGEQTFAELGKLTASELISQLQNDL